MTREEIIKLLNAKVLVDGAPDHRKGYQRVCACDMMSELLTLMNNQDEGHQSPEVVLLTSLANPQVIRTSEMVDIRLVVLLRDKAPMPETADLARECGITIMTTPYTMFRSCGLLYSSEMKDVERK